MLNLSGWGFSYACGNTAIEGIYRVPIEVGDGWELVELNPDASDGWLATFGGAQEAEANQAAREHNAHASLVAALESLEYRKEPGRFCDHAAEPCPRCEQARAALVLAKEK